MPYDLCEDEQTLDCLETAMADRGECWVCLRLRDTAARLSPVPHKVGSPAAAGTGRSL